MQSLYSQPLLPEQVCPSSLAICEDLQVIEDPRRKQAIRHPLIGILIMALCAIAAGADGWDDIADTAELHFEWFKEVTACGKQPPCPDTFPRVIQSLKPECLQKALEAWLIRSGLEKRPGRQICFDGKALRGSKGVHIVNAFDPKDRVTLGQISVGEKQNEITALPALREVFDRWNQGKVGQFSIVVDTYLYIKDMVAYMKIEFGVTYTVPGLRNWLQRHEFAYKKPAIVPGKASKEQQEKWLKEYEKLREKLPVGETICFIDGVHPTHNVQPAYGWIKKGVRKETPANTGRARLNLSGAIDITNHNILIREDRTLNAESTIEFFQNIEKSYPSKDRIHIFCDNAPYYRNKKVKKYLKLSKIILHFLPPYSPNLNPIERLWKWMKERVIYNTYYEHFEEFKGAIMGFFALLSTLGADCPLGQELRSKVRDKFRPIGTPAANF